MCMHRDIFKSMTKRTETWNQFFSFLLRLIYETLKFKQYLALSQKFEGMFVLFNDIAGFIQSKEGGGRGDRMTARG